MADNLTADEADIRSAKRRLRSTALTARRAVPAGERAAADSALVAGAASLAHGMAIVTAYAPMPGEPGGADLLDSLAAVVTLVLLPVLRPDRDLDWAAYGGPGSLGPPSSPGGPSGSLREPTGPRLGPEAVSRADLVIVPAVAVDASGVRLGRGGGSYDRALARVRPGTPVAALLYDGEVVAAVPAEPHDQRVTTVLTPSGIMALPRDPRDT
jgi:5-formyltetrahydrofolate cyclo-ligase